MINESKNHVSKETKITSKNIKVDDLKSAGATPHGHNVFVRFGADTCAKKAHKKLRLSMVDEANLSF